MPPPTTSRRRGTSVSRRAPVESTIRGSSHGKSGSRTGFDPTAMIACSNPTRRVPPSGVATARTRGPSNRPIPCNTSILRRFARPASPPVRRWTTPSFQASSFAASTAGAAKSTPRTPSSAAAVIASAVLSSALEGMQPTLRQTPPRVGYRSTSTVRRPRSAARKAAV